MLSVSSALRHAVRVSFLAFVLPVLTASAFAQQAPDLYRTQGVSVFGDFLYDNIAFRPGSDAGFSAGLDLTHYFIRTPLAASLEGRVNFASGSTADERTYTFGPRVEYRLGRFRPYGEAEVGIGTIHFGSLLRTELGYYGDKSVVIAGGGGIDIDLFRNLAAEFDFQTQHWNVSPQYNEVFNPSLVSFGVHYTLPFRSFIRAGDPQYR